MTSSTESPAAQKAKGKTSQNHQWRRLALEMGPLLVFFIANAKAGIFAATGLFMGATVLALVLSWVLERRIPVMPLVAGVMVLVFGGLTLALDDDLFIKLKPTIVNGLFAGAIFVGLFLGKHLLKIAFGSAIEIDDEGWRKLSWRWGFFFVFLAVLNEFVWRNFDTDFWVSFKVFGIMPITLIFSLSQLPLILKHQTKDDAESDETEADKASA
ncbi:MAG: septation protein A [Magnetovibrionaceae bacterium]